MRCKGWAAVALALGCAVLLSGCSLQSALGAFRPSARVTAQQRELRFVIQKLESHPMLANAAKREAFKTFAAKELALAASPLPNWRIVDVEERLAAWFHDPHTAVYGFAASYPGASALPVAFYWASDGLVTMRLPDTPTTVQTGDRVLAISGVPTEQVQRRLTSLIAGDAIFVRYFGAVELRADSTLRGLGLVSPRGRVALRLQRADGSTFTAELPLRSDVGRLLKTEWSALEGFDGRFEVPMAELQQGHQSTNWTWFVTPRYGFFVLTSCVDDASYRQAVSAFFQEVAAQRSPVIVLDLQQNGGGSSNVIAPWLEHLPLKYESSDVNLAFPQGFAPFLPLIPPTFDGRLYVLQSDGTFSSAMMMADALTGPGLGVRVGSTIGEATAGWGNVALYVTPVLHVAFQVSSNWVSAIKGKARATLPAQIPLNLTVGDIQHGTNPVVQWLATLP